LCALFAGTVAVLASCPADTEELLAAGNDYIAEAVLLNEKAKYKTAVTFEFDEDNADENVTARFIQLKPGALADSGVAVSISGVSGNGYFYENDGKVAFSGIMPQEGEVEKEITNGKDEELVERDEAIPNGEVITLLFQKDGQSDTLEVLGIVERKGAKAERIAVTRSDTFVLYGFDVINSGYINRSEVKVTRPILDVDKVNAANMVDRAATTSSAWETVVGESVSELFESLNVSASAAYKGVMFSGKAEAEFSTSRNSTATKKYAKGRGFHVVREERLADTSPAKLRDLLYDGFTTDLSTQSAAYMLDSYGTHLIARSYWGGEAEFNYSYTGTSLTTEQDIKAALNASYGGFSGSVSAENKNKATELNNNSSFISSTRGGNNSAFTSAEQFAAGYSAWVQSVEAKPDICAIPNVNSDLIPIWTIAEKVNPAKAALIKAEFDRRAAVRGVALAGYTYIPAYSYVTGINVISQQSEAVPSGYTRLVRTDMYNPNGGGALDANNRSGGDWIRIPYKVETGNSNHGAIAEIAVVSTGKSGTAPTWSGWNTIHFDLNKGAGGSFIWLLYRKVNSSDTMAIDFIGSYCESGGAGSGQILNGYEWVSGRCDLNQGASGSWIFLTTHKSPFKW
jgi:hypothetical protein